MGTSNGPRATPDLSDAVLMELLLKFRPVYLPILLDFNPHILVYCQQLLQITNSKKSISQHSG